MLQAPAPVTSFPALPGLQPRAPHAIARTYLGRSPDSHDPTSLPMPWRVLFLGSATNTGHTFRNRTLSSTSLHREGLAFPKRPTAEASTWTALRHFYPGFMEKQKLTFSLNSCLLSGVLALCHTRFVSRNDLQPIWKPHARLWR